MRVYFLRDIIPVMNRKLTYLFSVALIAAVFTPLSTDAYVFLRNLKQGDTGLDVRELQIVLNSNPLTQVSQTGAGSPGQETTYFGNATRRAVKVLQEMYKGEILSPLGLSFGSGFVGEKTRIKLNQLSANMTGPASSAASSPGQRPQSLLSGVPVITHLSTTTIGDSDVLIIYGKNFLPYNNVIILGELPDKYKAVFTASSTSITINFSSTVTNGLRKNFEKFDKDVKSKVIENITNELSKSSNRGGGWYFPSSIYVKNDYGTSNSVPVSINFLKGI
jgi:peptidoglycan hydrolase-like protein with peptidoglycan-binding domain